jgi:peptidoglycan/xylan/chitin deacetylase (PgdA/CDA1 family)
MTTTYPRDLIGYGRNTPDPKWPGGANVAVQFVVNYEEGGESSILDGDPSSERCCRKSSARSPGRPAQSQHGIDLRIRFARRLLAAVADVHRARVPVTCYGVTQAMARNPEAVAAMKEADWEIASHGYRWLEYKDFSEEEERRHILEAMRCILKSPASGRSACIRASLPTIR